ncbi:MAG TPA: transcriptional regulator [Rhizobium sp.]|nr:transcriptional regulator [Rhizobium sp.]
MREARAKAGYKTPTDAARAHPRSINVNTLISHENGNRDISRKSALKYAEIFGVEAGWILYAENGNPERGDVEVPLLSLVSAGNLRDQPSVTAADVIGHIKVADLAKGDWIALQVDGDSMDRIAPPGSIIMVDRSDHHLIDGKYYIFSLASGEATFKRWRKSPARLQPYSTNPDHMSIPASLDDLYIFGRVKRVIQDI